MKHNAQELRRRVAHLRGELRTAERDLDNFVRNCDHQWGETKYTPDIRKAYTTQGDPPGTMGIDWQGPCHVPREVTKKWTRTCELCGHVDTTTRTTEHVTETPRF